MSLRKRLQDKAVQAGKDAARKAGTSVPARVAGDGLRGFRGMLDGSQEPPSVEFFLLSLVRAVRSDELDADRSRRQVYVAARKRRRRLGLAAVALGPLTGAANRVADLYCEAAMICDLADFHGQALSDDQVAAHLLVLWGIASDTRSAREAVGGNPPVATLLGKQLLDQLGERLPDEPTQWAIAKALWEVRPALGAARRGATTEAAHTIAFSGTRTKRVIERIEAQLGVCGR